MKKLEGIMKDRDITTKTKIKLTIPGVSCDDVWMRELDHEKSRKKKNRCI